MARRKSLRAGRRRARLAARQPRTTPSPLRRPLRFEPLEDRRLLAVFTVDNLDDAGPGSLRDAIDQANNLAGHDEIVFAGAGAAGTIGLTTGQLSITDSLTITGPGRFELSIASLTLSRVINFATPAGGEAVGDLSISGVTLTGGLTTGNNVLVGGEPTTTHSGGGIRFLSSGNLTITNAAVVGNSTAGARAAGGGIFTSSGVVILNDSIVERNSTSGLEAPGGGVYVDSGVVEANRSDFVSNMTTGSTSPGGAVAANSGAIHLAETRILINRTFGVGSQGGGIAAGDGAVTLAKSLVSGNRVDNSGGGGIRTGSGELTLIDSVVNNNEAGGGGGISTSGGAVTLTGSVVNGNRSLSFAGAGGGIAVGGELTLNNSAVYDNQSRGRGGGITILDGSVVLNQSQVTGNRVESTDPFWGGGVYALRASVTLIDSNVSGNIVTTGGQGNSSSPVMGGGIIARYGDVTVVDSTVSDNVVNAASSNVNSHGLGGGIAVDRGNVTLIGATVTGNTAAGPALGAGGGIYASGGFISGGIYTGGAIHVTDSTISGNSVHSTQSGGSNSGGGGINVRGDLAVVNSTVSGNHSTGRGGGIYISYGGAARIANSTVTGNTAGRLGGGIAGRSTNSTLGMHNAIVAGNMAAEHPDVSMTGSAIVSPVNYSLIGDTSGSPITSATGVGNLLNQAPLLGPLADNGGPTFTHALLPGSPALDAGRAPPTPLYNYRLDGSLADAEGAGAPLVALGGALTDKVYEFSANQGLEAQAPAANAENYALEILFKVEQLGGYQKLVDFSSPTYPDAGLYVFNDRLRYLVKDNGVSFFTTSRALVANTWYRLVLTRDDNAAGPLSLYVDGEFWRSFGAEFTPAGETEAHRLGVFSEPGAASDARVVRLFHSTSGFGPPGAGAVDQIRFYDGPLDAVDVAAAYVTLEISAFDQRGTPFGRVAGAAIDLGAYEAQSVPAGLPGDYNSDGFVDAADLPVWTGEFGQTGTGLDADGNQDGAVDGADFLVWQRQLGQGAGGGSTISPSAQPVAFAAAAANPKRTAPPLTQAGSAFTSDGVLEPEPTRGETEAVSKASQRLARDEVFTSLPGAWQNLRSSHERPGLLPRPTASRVVEPLAQGSLLRNRQADWAWEQSFDDDRWTSRSSRRIHQHGSAAVEESIVEALAEANLLPPVETSR